MSTPSLPSSRLNRRAFHAVVAASALAPAAWVRAQDNSPVRIAQSIALSGPLGDLGQAVHQGAKAYFQGLNARGGVNGRPIELVTVDDGYDVKRAMTNVEGFLGERDLFALFNCFGTPMVGAMLPKVLEANMPFIAPFTGALLARPKNRLVFNIRASYPDEAAQLVRHLATIGNRRIGIAYQNNAFGKEFLEGSLVAMKEHQVGEPTAAVTVENSGEDAEASAAKLIASKPEAVLLGLAGKPTLDFIKAMRRQRRGLPLYALSVMGSAATLQALGEDGVGVVVSQVVPLPTATVVPVVRDFNQAWKDAGVTLEPSHLALEGYINARVFAEALRRAGPKPTREAFVDACWGLKRLDLGGFDLTATEPGRNASRFVELTMVGRGGKFIR